MIRILQGDIACSFHWRPSEWLWERGCIWYDGCHYFVFAGPIRVEIWA